jgi:UDPglucose--hexose-1-phosphate uridylyltransferase
VHPAFGPASSSDGRVDPLTEHTSRILPERGLMPANEFDLEAFAVENQPRCPFCPERVNDMTPSLPAAISAEGRIADGEAVLFPNLHAYSSHSSVSIYSSRLHYLPLGQMTDGLVADNLRTQVAYAKANSTRPVRARWRSPRLRSASRYASNRAGGTPASIRCTVVGTASTTP